MVPCPVPGGIKGGVEGVLCDFNSSPKGSVIYMTAAAQQRIMNVVKDLPDDAEGAVINFMMNYKRPEDKEAAERKARADAFLNSFMNVEIDEQAITTLREKSMVTIHGLNNPW